MKWLLLVAVWSVSPLQGEEAPATLSVREKVKARIVESMPPAPAESPASDPAPDDSLFVLEPMVVSESRAVRELERTLVSEQERRKAEAFSTLKGGTIFRNERMEVGGWWTPSSGWQFLKLKW
ncbi:MAG TPA: hypothetical protein VHN79_09145 [Lacunisphaera sp.]|nr:hypothetical protein [Lacunisphaera sp.]